MRRISVNVKFTVNCISPTPGATLFVKSPYNPLPNAGRGVVGRTIDTFSYIVHIHSVHSFGEKDQNVKK